jgi:hypothetical protein
MTDIPSRQISVYADELSALTGGGYIYYKIDVPADTAVYSIALKKARFDIDLDEVRPASHHETLRQLLTETYGHELALLRDGNALPTPPAA